MVRADAVLAGVSPHRNLRVLVIEHDTAAADEIEARLRFEGFDTHVVQSAERGLELLREGGYSLVFIEQQLPGMSGDEACRAMRDQRGESLPIILLSTSSAVEDRIAGFAAGADDYITRPIDARELMMRARAVVRRHRGSEASAAGDYCGPAGLVLCEPSRTVTVGEQQIHLTPTEFRVLRELLLRRGEALAADALSSRVWGYETFGERNYLEAQISRLRSKLAAAGANRVIETVRGYGYLIR